MIGMPRLGKHTACRVRAQVGRYSMGCGRHNAPIPSQLIVAEGVVSPCVAAALGERPTGGAADSGIERGGTAREGHRR